MKKNILIVLFVSLLSYGNETITKSMDFNEYTNVELIVNPNQHIEFNSNDKISCSQCHGCKRNEDFIEEEDNMELLHISSSEVDTITKVNKNVEFKLVKS